MRSRRLCASCAPSCAPSPPSCSRLSLHPIRVDGLREILAFGPRAGACGKFFSLKLRPISRLFDCYQTKFLSHYKTSHNYCMTNRDFYRSLDFFIIKTIQAILKTPIPTHQRRIPDEKMDCFICQFDDDRLMLPVSLGMYAHTFRRLPQPDKQL